MHYYDTLQKIDLTDSGKFSRENKQDDTAASIPVSDIYIADGGLPLAMLLQPGGRYILRFRKPVIQLKFLSGGQAKSLPPEA